MNGKFYLSTPLCDPILSVEKNYKLIINFFDYIFSLINERYKLVRQNRISQSEFVFFIFKKKALDKNKKKKKIGLGRGIIVITKSDQPE